MGLCPPGSHRRLVACSNSRRSQAAPHTCLRLLFAAMSPPLWFHHATPLLTSGPLNSLCPLPPSLEPSDHRKGTLPGGGRSLFVCRQSGGRIIESLLMHPFIFPSNALSAMTEEWGVCRAKKDELASQPAGRSPRL